MRDRVLWGPLLAVGPHSKGGLPGTEGPSSSGGDTEDGVFLYMHNHMNGKPGVPAASVAAAAAACYLTDILFREGVRYFTSTQL